MKKILIIFLFLFLYGCQSEPIVKSAEFTGISQKEFEVAGERVVVGGEMLLGADTIQDFKPEVKLEKWGDETYIPESYSEAELRIKGGITNAIKDGSNQIIK